MWRLSSGIPIPNAENVKKIFTTVNATYTSGTSLTTADSDLRHKFLLGEIIKIGPSNHANNPGASEYAKITAVSGTGVITLEAALNNDYAVGDHIEGFTHSLASGWEYSSTLDVGVYYNMKNMVKLGGTGLLIGGYNRSFTGHSIYKYNGDSSGYLYIYSKLGLPLINGITYRLGGWFKNSSFSGTVANLKLFPNSSSFTSGEEITVDLANSYSTWTEVDELMISAYTGNDDNNAMISLEFRYDTTFDYFSFDSLFLTHTKGLDNAANGVYIIQQDPISVDESIDFNKIEKLQAEFQKSIYYGRLKTQNEHKIHLGFIDATYEFIKNLEMLTYWQNIGGITVLESTDTDLMKPMFGFIDYNLTYPHWDNSNLIGLDLYFVGV